MLVPRIRAKAIKEGSHWNYEIFITVGPDTEENKPLVMTSKNIFISKEAALAEVNRMLPGLIKTICSAMELPKPTGYIDLKKNETVDFLNGETDGI